MPKEKPLTKPFKAEGIWANLAQGHLLRKGHKLKAHWEQDKDAEYYQILVRECCKD